MRIKGKKGKEGRNYQGSRTSVMKQKTLQLIFKVFNLKNSRIWSKILFDLLPYRTIDMSYIEMRSRSHQST